MFFRTKEKKSFPRLPVSLPEDNPFPGDILVCVFLRGGMDGLNAVIPYGDPDYHHLRSSLRISEPKPAEKNAAVDLDGFFGLHPSLLPFKSIWDEQALAVIHAVGSPHPTHSHFDAMVFMEHGSPGDRDVQTGWLARHLISIEDQNQSPVRVVNIGAMIPSSLDGPVPAIALSRLAEFKLGRQYDVARVSKFETSLAFLYNFGSPMDGVAALTLQAAEILDNLPTNMGAAEYPQSDFGQSMQLVAHLIEANIGLEVVTVDINGWDTHINQGAIEGHMPRLLSSLSESLTAFYYDMGEAMKNITVVVMSEFGRRAAENSGGGTDHGHGNAMFVIGGNIRGGKVYGQWPGLAPEDLAEPGDLAVTTDFRAVLGEIVEKRLKNNRVTEVFPGFTQPEFLGLTN